MNVLILGGGNGSWLVRGRQLGRAIGARVLSKAPAPSDLKWADLVVLVKRAEPAWADLAHHAGKPVVWDALDFWHQPEENSLTAIEASHLLREQMARYRPVLVLGATQAMAAAADGVVLPHHARPGLTPGPVRDRVKVVAYEGTKKYLGRWATAVSVACEKRGWQFLINPPDLRQADLIVALRDGLWDGWMCREWKSGVKVVNAIAAGRPIISQPCAAMHEFCPDGTAIDRPDQLDDALDFWTSWESRAAVARHAHERWPSLSLAAVSDRYRDILRRVSTQSEAVAC